MLLSQVNGPRWTHILSLVFLSSSPCVCGYAWCGEPTAFDIAVSCVLGRLGNRDCTCLGSSLSIQCITFLSTSKNELLTLILRANEMNATY